tara:strand:- start:2553 stop:2771 length:219 start_codon:yes stop_codon:yes gene_type:complete
MQKQLAFISQTRDVHDRLEALKQRADDEGSQFKIRITIAMDTIREIVDTYDEVLDRDSNEDESYIPPLKEIK